ncbi:glycerate kinase [Papilio machaon]|uniref:glycerate kinase n=1 Tax=Papilio machaon TaxID=76193 RepID=UPI001E665FCB|nr:glycerate kinase [Papilio machaon]
MAKAIVNDLIQIFKSGVTAVLPENIVKKCLNYSPITQNLKVCEENYDLKNKKVYVIGTGKAAQNMAVEVEKLLGRKITEGIISIPKGSLNKNLIKTNISYYEGAKDNLPDKEAMITAKKIDHLITNLGKDDFLLILISGGGSALLPLPVEPISLSEKTTLIKQLAHSGADIKELNAVRKRISALKGGQLALKSKANKTIALILSDIVGDPLDLIASGPTSENTDNPEDALNIIKKYNLYDKLSQSIITVLEKNYQQKPFPKEIVTNFIIGSNKLSTEAAAIEAIALNYFPIQLSNIVTGNVKEIAFEYANLIKAFCDFLSNKINAPTLKDIIDNLSITGLNSHFVDSLESIKEKDICLILGGEITVEVKGNGLGGRNHQLALEFSYYLNNIKNKLNNYEIYFLSAGTDGIDGPTDAAGAIGYINLISDCELEQLDVNSYLNNNDSYNFYKKFKNGSLHIKTGHTNTNVMDIHLILIKRHNY